MFSRIAVLGLMALWLWGCANGHCRVIAEQQKAAAEKNAAPPTTVQKGGVTVTKTAVEKVMVYKYDGTLQCNQGKLIPIELMKKDLDGITVYSQSSKPDGVMRIQLCGTPTGMAHLFEIAKADVDKAIAKGFQVWNFE